MLIRTKPKLLLGMSLVWRLGREPKYGMNFDAMMAIDTNLKRWAVAAFLRIAVLKISPSTLFIVKDLRQVHVWDPTTSDWVKTVHHLEKDRAQLACFGEAVNLSKANTEPQLMETKHSTQQESWCSKHHVRTESAVFNQFYLVNRVKSLESSQMGHSD